MTGLKCCHIVVLNFFGIVTNIDVYDYYEKAKDRANEHVEKHSCTWISKHQATTHDNNIDVHLVECVIQ